jgi:hypothetical protein
LIQYPYNASSRQGTVYFHRQTFPREIVHDIQQAQSPTIGHLIVHKIHRPGVIGMRRRIPQNTTPTTPNLFASAPSHLQPFLTI